MIAQLEEKDKKALEGLDFHSLEVLESKTDVWLKKKMGRFSASEAHRLMTYIDKDELPKGAQTYATEKAVESLLTDPEPSYSNDSMSRGLDEEGKSMMAFMERTGLLVEKYGEDQEFIELGKNCGCTPDGLIGEDMGVEGKNPNSKTHLFYLQNLKTPEDLKKHCANYYGQVQFSMYVTGRKTWYFYSYDSRYRNDNHKLLTIKIGRDEVYIEKLKERLKLAIAFKNKIVRELNG